MSALGKLAAAVLVAGTAHRVGLTAGEKGWLLASLSGMAGRQLAALMGNDAAATPSADAPKVRADRADHLLAAPRRVAGMVGVRGGDGGWPRVSARAGQRGSLAGPCAEPAPAGGAERSILFTAIRWACPTPRRCRRDSMGMDYIAVYEGGDSDDGSVTVSPGKLQRTGVRTGEAVLAPLGRFLARTGDRGAG